MTKIKFKDVQKKHNHEFVEDVTTAYIDITNETKNIFGNIVKKAILIVGEYNEMMGSLDEWKQIYKETEYEFNNYIEIDGNSMYIVFTNGLISEFKRDTGSNIVLSRNEINNLKFKYTDKYNNLSLL